MSDYIYWDLPEYRLFLPLQAVGASTVHFDLFNATTTGLNLILEAVIPIVSGATAVTGAVSADLFLTRTTAVGTGGTAATFSGTDITAATISFMGSGLGQALPVGVTARLTPSAGATAGAVISACPVFGEETNAGAYVQNDFVRRALPYLKPLIITQGTGIRVVQGAVASTGNVGFDVIFRVQNR